MSDMDHHLSEGYWRGRRELRWFILGEGGGHGDEPGAQDAWVQYSAGI